MTKEKLQQHYKQILEYGPRRRDGEFAACGELIRNKNRIFGFVCLKILTFNPILGCKILVYVQLGGV